MQAPSLRDCLDINDTGIDISTSSMMDGGDTMDISMTDSISFDTCSVNEEAPSLGSTPSSKEVSPDHKSLTLPSRLDDIKNSDRDELDELLQVERKIDDGEKLYQTLPPTIPSRASAEQSLLSPVSSTATDHSAADSEFKSAVETSDESTLTGRSSDEFVTPLNTLGPNDFEEFKQQIRNEYILNTSELRNSRDDTLKARHPIDPSRINDSLKLYSENMMSKSYGGEAALRVIAPEVPYQTLKVDRSESSDSQGYYALRKSGSAAVTSTSDDSTLTTSESSINRSKSGPNWFRNNSNGAYDVDSDEDTPTLKPSTIKKRAINIKMDCYDEISNGVTSTSADSSTTHTTQTTPTSPNNNDEYLCYNSLGDDDNDDDVGVVVLRKPKAGSTAIKRRSGNKRCVRFGDRWENET